jgi:hypothetical protein
MCQVNLGKKKDIEDPYHENFKYKGNIWALIMPLEIMVKYNKKRNISDNNVYLAWIYIMKHIRA